MNRIMRSLVLGLAAFLVSACTAAPIANDLAGEEPRSGRILLWHNWVGRSEADPATELAKADAQVDALLSSQPTQ